MKRIQLHPGSSEFSAIAAGLWRLDQWDHTPQDTLAWINSSMEVGITTFDHADIYGNYTNEARFGEALKLDPSLRDKIELVSKCDICLVGENRPGHRIQHYNTTPKHITASVKHSLKNLHTDYLDLLLLHRPDPLMDADATAGALSGLLKEGKIKQVGVSNFTQTQFDLLQSRLSYPIVTNQVECSLVHLDPIFDGTFDHAQKNRARPMLWSPFAGGDLFTGNGERSARIRNTIEPLTQKYSATAAQISLAWLLALPCRPQPVMGTGKTDRLREAAGALEVKLERQDWFTLLAASQGHDVP